MRITKTKSNKNTTYYLTKSVSVNGKSTTKTIERLGTKNELLQRMQTDTIVPNAASLTIDQWCKEYAKIMTDREKEKSKNIQLVFNPARKHNTNFKTVNIGYIYIEAIFNKLGLQNFSKKIAKEKGLDINLSAHLLNYVANHYTVTSYSHLNNNNFCNYINSPSIDANKNLQALKVIADNYNNIVDFLYESYVKNKKPKAKCLTYSSARYHFETYGKFKSIVLEEIIDDSTIPVVIRINGIRKETKDNTKIFNRVVDSYKNSSLFYFNDNITSVMDDKHLKEIKNLIQLDLLDISRLNNQYKKQIISRKGWSCLSDRKKYNLDEIDKQFYLANTFYKRIQVTENENIGKYIYVIYAPAYENYIKTSKEPLFSEQLQYLENKRQSLDDTNANLIDEIENDKNYWKVVDALIRESHKNRFLGYGATYVRSKFRPRLIEKVLQSSYLNLWYYRHCIDIPYKDYLISPQNKTVASVAVSYITCVLTRWLGSFCKTGSTPSIIPCINDMNFIHLPGRGYLPCFDRTTMHDELDAAFGINTNYEFIKETEMKNILKQALGD